MKKTHKTRLLRLLLLVMLASLQVVFSQSKPLNLWNEVPNAIQNNFYKEETTLDAQGKINGISQISIPTITPFLAKAKKNNGTAIVIFPGGGYHHVSINKEGFKIAKWLNTLGISAFVVKYRMPNDLIATDKKIVPLQDAQQALKIVRKNTKKWKLDASKIGVMGFSAGGHLAATLSCKYAEIVTATTDTTPARPDFAILVYPVISMQNNITHKGTQTNLLGDTPTQETINFFSNEKQVNAQTPKTFLVHASNDKAVVVENSIQYYLALKQNNISTELQIYETGGHGFGLGTEGSNTYWPMACQNWLQANGILDVSKK